MLFTGFVEGTDAVIDKPGERSNYKNEDRDDGPNGCMKGQME
jgi:hypothetical protein